MCRPCSLAIIIIIIIYACWPSVCLSPVASRASLAAKNSWSAAAVLTSPKWGKSFRPGSIIDRHLLEKMKGRPSLLAFFITAHTNEGADLGLSQLSLNLVTRAPIREMCHAPTANITETLLVLYQAYFESCKISGKAWDSLKSELWMSNRHTDKPLFGCLLHLPNTWGWAVS